MDDLVSANSYRAKLVQNHISCPTILTRQGDRVSSKGKFGGRHNKAPPIAALKVFGAPLPDHYNALKEQIDLLHEYQSILQKRNEAKKEREDHIKLMNSPEEQAKKQDMEQKKMQLETIERQLESTPNRPMKRGPEGPGEPSGIITKRAKQRST
uniref:structural maintenance of chromosomes flexible hinge domain-containing protein 1-like isoform X1 n=1 Tax=Monopterus albus TaxID=43700 RepID=UPI0009B4E0B7|nr:structural maintenance of chromosomes flexible hinge domain-containing protein 1-like isoform X1 [Monopterus albus]